MSKLSREQLITLAKGAGFTGDEVNIAVAIALAESGGNTLSHNTTPPDDSYGLWQINMYKDLGPSRRKWFGLTNDNELFNPYKNAKAAHMVYKASGWKAWTTYTRGTYKKFMTGDAGDAGDTAAAPTEEDSGTDTGAGGIEGAIGAIGSSLFKGIANVGGLLVAITFIVLGVVILLRDPLSNMIPVNKIIKKAGMK